MGTGRWHINEKELKRFKICYRNSQNWEYGTRKIGRIKRDGGRGWRRGSSLLEFNFFFSAGDAAQ